MQSSMVTPERLAKYFEVTGKALAKVKIATEQKIEWNRSAEDFLDMARRYYADARHFSEKGDKVLDVGSGSGWTTALLANLAGETGKVFGVEIIPELVVGNSTEEIDTSIEKAKVKYAEIQNELRQKYNLPTEVENKKIENEQEEKINIPRLGSKADLGKWESQRKDLLKEVYGKYGLNV